MGVNQNFFKPIFLDVFFDVDSESFLVFAFGASGTEIWPFFWFWPLHREIFLSRFLKKWKKSFKSGSKKAYLVQNFSLIIYMKFILVYLVPPTHKLAKTFKKIDFQLLFSRDRDIFGKNGYVRWTRLKKFFKMSKSCFFRKNHRMDLI